MRTASARTILHTCVFGSVRTAKHDERMIVHNDLTCLAVGVVTGFSAGCKKENLLYQLQVIRRIRIIQRVIAVRSGLRSFGSDRGEGSGLVRLPAPDRARCCPDRSVQSVGRGSVGLVCDLDLSGSA